jgi:hypothetical protein
MMYFCQEKLCFEEWLKPLINKKLVGCKYPSSVVWQMVPKAGGTKEIQMTFKGAM